MLANSDLPSADDFLGSGQTNIKTEQNKYSNVSNSSNSTNIRQSFNLKRGGKSGQKIDYNYFDSKLIDRGITLLHEYKKIY